MDAPVVRADAVRWAMAVGWRPAMLVVVVAVAAWRGEALSVTVTDTECIHEFVPYEGDTVSGNFVVVDHDIFWSSDHPGIDLTVPAPDPPRLRCAFDFRCKDL